MTTVQAEKLLTTEATAEQLGMATETRGHVLEQLGKHANDLWFVPRFKDALRLSGDDLAKLAAECEATDDESIPGSWHAMTQLQLSEQIGDRSTIQNWAEAAKVPKRKAQGDTYTAREVRKIIEWGAANGKGASRAAAKTFLAAKGG